MVMRKISVTRSKSSGIARKDLFIITKLYQTLHNPESVERAIDESLALLDLEYVDLYLLHAPYAYKHGPDYSALRHAGSNKESFTRKHPTPENSKYKAVILICSVMVTAGD